jgi:hypothetical protein
MTSKKSTKRQSRKQATWLVDYDEPKSACTRRFYRKLKQNKYKPTSRSTSSVLLFDNQEKAQAVFSMAAQCGKANLYRVRKKALTHSKK